VGARPGKLGQPRTHSLPGGPALLRAGRRERPGEDRRHGAGLRHGVPRPILEAPRAAGAQVGSIVMALSPPRHLRGGPPPGTRAGGAPVRPGGRRRPPGIRCRTVHQFPLRTADSFPCGFVAIGRNGRHSHQFQLRTARSFRDERIPVVVMGGLTSSSCAPRAPSGRRAARPGPRRLCTAVRAAQEVVEADLARCGRGSPGVIPSSIDDRSRCAPAAPPSSRALRLLVTPASSRGYDPLVKGSDRG